MRLVLMLGLSLAAAGCTPYHDPAPLQPRVTTAPPPPITGTVVVQPQP